MIKKQTPRAVLVDLLLTLFNTVELRAFISRVEGGPKLRGLLPSASASLLELADGVVDVFKRHGYIDSVFFTSLVEVCPRRRAEISRVADAWRFPIDDTRSTAPSSEARIADWRVDLPRKSTVMWDVFISYDHADQDVVHELAVGLHEIGLRVFLDTWEVVPGDVFVHRRGEGLVASGSGVFVVSATSVAHPRVMEEYAALLTAAMTEGRRLIPVLIENAKLPLMLATRKPVDLRGKTGDEFRETLRKLAMAIFGKRPGPPTRRSKNVI